MLWCSFSAVSTLAAWPLGAPLCFGVFDLAGMRCEVLKWDNGRDWVHFVGRAPFQVTAAKQPCSVSLAPPHMYPRCCRLPLWWGHPIDGSFRFDSVSSRPAMSGASGAWCPDLVRARCEALEWDGGYDRVHLTDTCGAVNSPHDLPRLSVRGAGTAPVRSECVPWPSDNGWSIPEYSYSRDNCSRLKDYRELASSGPSQPWSRCWSQRRLASQRRPSCLAV